MRIAFRVDASDKIGVGHIVRCQSLARAMLERGASVLFIARHVTAGMREALERDGCALALLPAANLRPADGDNSYGAWLGVTEDVDAAQTLEILTDYLPAAVVVDHYALSQSWERQMRAIAARVVAIDDIARTHDCDVLIDQNLSHAPQERYEGRVPANCKLLLGPHYALLQPDYAAAATRGGDGSGAVKRIAVFFGGADSCNMTAKTLEALSAPQFNGVTVDIVIGAANSNADTIKKLAALRADTHIVQPRATLAAIFATADIAIGAGGTTAWERCSCGVPSIIVSIADNQVPGSTALAEAGIARYLGDQSTVGVESLRASIEALIADESARREMSRAGRLLVDGWGARRVAEVIAPSPVEALAVRRATARDRAFLYRLANDPTVRAQSFNSAEIAWEDHVAWFADKISDPNTHLYILTAHGLAVGVIRFDISGPTATLNYALEAVGRGRKWGAVLVQLGLYELATVWTGEVHAAVKADNLASRLIFEKLGFRAVDTRTADHFFVLEGKGLRERFGR